jgi:hypothetical protein
MITGNRCARFKDDVKDVTDLASNKIPPEKYFRLLPG